MSNQRSTSRAAEPAHARPAGTSARASRSLLDPAIMQAGRGRQRPQARPPRSWSATRSCSSSGSAASSRRSSSSATSPRRRSARERVRRPRRRLAVVHGAVRQLRRGGGRGPRQGPSRHPAQGPLRHRRQPAAGRRLARAGALVAARRRRRRGRDRGRDDPVGRRDRRGHRLGRRVGHHGRVGSGDPRVGRRPLGRHRRHPGALGPDPGPHHRPARRDVPRPHDLARRGGQPPEDPQRDRAQHPVGRASRSSSCWPR